MIDPRIAVAAGGGGHHRHRHGRDPIRQGEGRAGHLVQGALLSQLFGPGAGGLWLGHGRLAKAGFNSSAPKSDG
jgi:hypothetical protein